MSDVEPVDGSSETASPTDVGSDSS
jgi:hypothetical protein